MRPPTPAFMAEGRSTAREAIGRMGRGGWKKPTPARNRWDMPTSNWSVITIYLLKLIIA